MRILAIALLVAVVYASGSLRQSNVGEGCMKNPIFNTTSFIVNPWPVRKDQQFSMTWSGTYIDKDYLREIYLGTKHGIDWKYSYVTFDKEYTKGQAVTYDLTLQGESATGSYEVQVTLHRHDFSILSCWQFFYSV